MSKRKMKKTDGQPGYGKLLDAWEPPDEAGEPIGCLVTSYTFSPDFFEEECLGRFLGMETDPQENAPAYLIEREDKAARISCAAAIVDQHHAKGARSLRWDLLPVRLADGILHAKISLLHWTNAVRLIVASANVTEDGYRRNREVFGVLDYTEGGEAPLACLTDCVEFLRSIVRLAHPEGRPAKGGWGRVERFLAGIRPAAGEWGLTGSQAARQPIRIRPILIAPRGPDVFRQLAAVWSSKGLPNSAEIISPFFDPPEADNQPAKRILDILRKSAAAVSYYSEAEDVPGEEITLFHGPRSLDDSAKASDNRSVATSFCRVCREKREKSDRPLHAKGIWLTDDKKVLYMVGSSNFTSAGTGLGRQVNLEANLAYSTSLRGSRTAYKELQASFVHSEKIDKARLRFLEQPMVNEDDPTGELMLPCFFDEAIYDSDQGNNAKVTFTFNGDPPANVTGWQVKTEDEPSALFAYEASWRACGSPVEWQLSWGKPRPPSGFLVAWDGAPGQAWWPVNVARPEALPPPDQLKDLPLEVLLDLLSSARSIHKGWLPRANGNGGKRPDGPKVDASGFLLQRTRRVSKALDGLRERLEKATPTPECLAWRLRGPIGVMAVATAIEKEGKSDGEKAFLLAEIALELCRVKPAEKAGYLPAARVRKELRAVARELCDMVKADTLTDPKLREYVQTALAAAGRVR